MAENVKKLIKKALKSPPKTEDEASQFKIKSKVSPIEEQLQNFVKKLPVYQVRIVQL